MYKLHHSFYWLRCRNIDDKPEEYPIGLDFPFAWDTERLDQFFFRPPPWPPFLLLSFVFLCFSFAFGALHAPSRFDLGQKEIENWTFCVSAAVYLIITANNDTDCIEPLGTHVSFESSTPGLTSASHLASYCLQRKNRIGFGRYPWFPRGTQDVQSRTEHTRYQ